MHPFAQQRANDLEFVFQYGTVLFHAGHPEEAYRQYLHCNELRPVTADVLNALALSAYQIKRFELAVHWFEALLRLDPHHLEGRLNLGSSWFELSRYEDALACYDQVLQANPDHAQAWYNRGVALRLLKRLNEAEDSYRTAIGISPDYAEAYSNLGVVLHERGDFSQALACYERAQSLRGDYAEAWSNAGATYMAMADYAKSLQNYEAALARNPQLPSACWNKGILLLLKGDFETGLPLYEWRFHHQRQALFRRALHLTTPRLRASDMVSGKRVFVYDEQGLGDALQMARYVPLLAARGAIVYLRVAAELHRLFTGLQGVTALFGDADDVPAHDFQCPMMSLPLACGTCIETIPADIPYLSVRPEYVRAMGERLPACAGLPRLGLVWGGNPRNPTDGKRSLPLVRLLGALPDGYAYVALQKQMSQADADLLQTDPRVHNAADLLSDFEDTAAICSALDGLITVDTSVAHLAGALGLPVMLLVSCVPDWRWMLDRDDSPWYPSLTIIRQPKPGDWTGALSELQKRLLPG